MRLFTTLLIIGLFLLACNPQNEDFKGETITFPSSDGITITADYYKSDVENASTILLFHQAGYSRGEYREIAPKLNKLGYHCLAIDQRSGDQVKGVKNETFRRAKKAQLNTEYTDALIDLEAAIDYAQERMNAKEVIIWGSSYSSSLVLYIGSKQKNIKAILSFSPGEYFKLNDKEIQDFASEISCPVFITSSKDEAREWKAIFENISSKKIAFVPTGPGKHGSKALWEEHEDFPEYWEAVKAFLKTL